MTTTARARPPAGLRRVAAATLVPVVVVAGLTACSGREDPPEQPAGSSTPEVPPLPTTARLGVVTGRIGATQQELALDKVTQAVDGWFDAAFVAGDYPRETFADAFPRFTEGATAEAVEDVMLMSNADLGQRIDGVTARVRRVRVDLLGTRGVAQAATARVRLSFDTQGSLERRVTVTGVLRLVRQGKVWRVFAYDIAKGEAPLGPSASASGSPTTTGEAG